MRFEDRTDAGRRLGEALAAFAHRPGVIVLGLPRGGVPVAFEVARRLGAPLDVFLVRKLGVPGQPELAMGAIAEGGVEVLSDDLIAELGVPPALVQQVAVRERLELDRRDQLYRRGRPRPPLRDRTVILVDDGLATGSTMQAAVVALRTLGPARIVVAAPVGARDTCARLRKYADEVACLATPEPFQAVGLWYGEFSQTTDDEVRRLLDTGHAEPAASDGRTATAGVRAEGPVAAIRRLAVPLTGDAHDYDRLLDDIGDARLVLLGEGSHGTHEFYRERARITQRLIVEKGFAAVAVEADWPDAYRINQFVRSMGTDEEAIDALGDFARFPAWMWRNADVLDFVGWLRTHNDARVAPERTGFYGVDLYSLRASAEAVIAYLENVDSEAARRAKARYGCFDQFGVELQEYGYAAALGMSPSCEREVLAQLVEMHRRRAVGNGGSGAPADALFHAQQNARLVANAEAYYRSMFDGRVASWNLRDRHMAETVRELAGHLARTRPGARLAVWAHNSHVGDARATEMGDQGELNLGQLLREHYGREAFIVGFTTHIGTVTAATEWGLPPHRRHVRPSLPGSYERLFHDTGIPRFLLNLRDPDVATALAGPHLERAIGVIYAPQTERRSHYLHARLPGQFDALIHVDETRAVEPLERTAAWDAGEIAETYPTGL
jgi:erythromycin esterase-like protein/adenine/guanine phosphoribosyltransferase-like PRPP-binding protein